MQRLPDWETPFAEFLDATADKPFQWGVQDCALFVADAVMAITGEDFGAPFRGKYDTVRGAAEALRDYGAGTLVKTLTAALGKPIHPAMARRGDVVMVGGNAGVCIGSEGLFVTDDGLHRLPRADWSKAWHVG